MGGVNRSSTVWPQSRASGICQTINNEQTAKMAANARQNFIRTCDVPDPDFQDTQVLYSTKTPVFFNDLLQGGKPTGGRRQN
jgi:hypothetical protein